MAKQTYCICYNVHYKNVAYEGVPGHVERRIIHITLDTPEGEAFHDVIPKIRDLLQGRHENEEWFEAITLNTVQQIHVVGT